MPPHALPEHQFRQIIQHVTSCNKFQAGAILDFVDVYKGGYFNFAQFYMVITLLVAMECRLTSMWYFIHQDMLVDVFVEGDHGDIMRKVSCLANLLELSEVAMIRYMIINHDLEPSKVDLSKDKTVLVHGLFEVFRFFDASFSSHMSLPGKSRLAINNDIVQQWCSIL